MELNKNSIGIVNLEEYNPEAIVKHQEKKNQKIPFNEEIYNSKQKDNP